MSRKDRIVIVGGGVGGAHAAAALRDRGIEDVTIYEPVGALPMVTRLAAVAGGRFAMTDATVPLGELTGAAVAAEKVASVSDDAVILSDGRQIEADHTIVCVGAEPLRPGIPGIDAALTLRTPDDAAAVRAAAAEADHMLVVGGGPTGSQLAGALAAGPYDVRVTLVDAEPRLLHQFGEPLGERTRTILEGRGVTVRLNADVDKFEADGAMVDGEWIEGTPVWTGGFEAVGKTVVKNARVTDGRLDIDAAGRVAGYERVWGVGDAAAHREPDGTMLPMSAQVATQAGEQVGANVARVALGGEAQPLDLHDRGWVVDLSGGRGVAELFGVALAAPVLDRFVPFLHDAIDARTLFQLGGKDALRYAVGKRNR